MAYDSLKPPIRLVCLDLGGVMMRICRDWIEAFGSATDELRSRFTNAQQVARCIAPLGQAYETGTIDDGEFDRRAAAALGLSEKQVAAAVDAWLKGPYPGATELIRRLGSSDGIRSACLTNTNRRHWRAMTEPGVHELGLRELTWRFTSFDAGHMKPDAGIYAYAEGFAAAEGIGPESILFFDDNPANVAAAASRGWRTEQIDPDGDAPGQVRTHLERYGVRT
jgi:HAD superfamily hydrolase (TIGR01509 family)